MAKGHWSLGADLPEPTRLEVRRVYRELLARYAPHGRLGLRWARLTAQLWVVVDAVSSETVRTVAQRQTGRGRRPDRAAVTKQSKRQALELMSLSAMLPGGLVGLVAAGQPTKPKSGDELLALMERMAR